MEANNGIFVIQEYENVSAELIAKFNKILGAK